MGGLAGLPGLTAVSDQLAARITVLQAEQARRDAGMEVRGPAWKNLVFTGGPGTGKSRAAAAAARGYRDLGLLPLGHMAEVAAADLVDPKPGEAARLVGEAAWLVPGGVLMITDAHAWYDLPDHGRQMLRCLYQLLTQIRDRVREDLLVILAGQVYPLGELLRANPALAARFPVVIDFPGYTADELAAIFATLAEEAGFTLTPAARAQGRHRTRTGRKPSSIGQRASGRPVAGPGHLRPGSPDHCAACSRPSHPERDQPS